MKKILLSLILIFAGNQILNAQNCVVDTSYSTPGYFPDSLFPAYINSPYSENITIVVPKDTLIELIPGFPLTIDIDSIVVTSITNLPVGFTFDCEPVSCGFLGNQAGCMRIIGNPVDPSLVGEYNLIGNVQAYASQAGALSPLAETVNLGKFLILNSSSANVLEKSGVNEIKVFPNPVSNQANIGFFASTNGNYKIAVTNILGEIVKEVSINVLAGNQQITLNCETLQEGIYLLNVSSLNQQTITKFIVSKN